jgi:hypothetical protein
MTLVVTIVDKIVGDISLGIIFNSDSNTFGIKIV